jgi:general stress protein 26
MGCGLGVSRQPLPPAKDIRHCKPGRRKTMAETIREPAVALDPQFSSQGARATPWAEGSRVLEEAQIYWLATVRTDGRPHVTPLLAIWMHAALYFCTGPGERKAKNLTHNAHCVITTGCNVLEGLDVVVEGEAVQVSDEAILRSLAALYASKYGWHYEVRDGAFFGDGGRALVYEVAPTTAFGFAKGETSSQTRWRFQE